MKQMSLIEMDGFLKGKCIPSDLKVNETNAEYLVRKFAEAQAKCAAMAAENAAMHETIEAVRSVADNSSGIAGWHLNGDIATWEEILPEINDIKTPATDAFLAEVKWSTKTGHRVRVFSSIDFPIRLVVTHHYIRAVLVRCNIQRYSPLLRELHR